MVLLLGARHFAFVVAVSMVRPCCPASRGTGREMLEGWLSRCGNRSAHVQAGLNVFQALMPRQLEMMALYQNKMTSNGAVFNLQPADYF